ncbi:MAG: tRNA(fMet)-specific endonuclease VapC [Sphingomonadales bacterium]|jgi:tRNA(fMet)-specific endonuclease VapC|nr:tRNA(fMet)-specific endonuclease VapC [Sphingomonadales bacterium]
MQYLIDTNIVIALTVRDDRTVGRMLNIHRRDSGLSTVVLHELYAGAYESKRGRRSLEVIETLGLPLLSFDAADARAAGQIKAVLKRKGTPIGPNDILIAGQALARGLTVVTRNVGEFRRVDGLAVEEWAG